MAIDLLNLKPQSISKNLKGKTFLIYGEAGCGKTTLASKFKNVLIAGFEAGTNALNNVYVQPVQTWADWKSMVRQLCSQPQLKDRFESIAIDTADEAWLLCTKWVCAQNDIEKLGDLPYGQAYDIAKKEFAGTFRDLIYNGYGLIFISHATEKAYKDNKGKEYLKIVPALPARPFDIINKMVDLIAYIREIPVGTEDKPKRERFMFFRDEVGDRFLSKSRYAYMVPKVRLDYDELVNAIYDAIDKQVEHEGGEITNEENAYNIRSFEQMMEEAHILWARVVEQGKVGQVNDMLAQKFGKPTKFSEILPEQSEQLGELLLEIQSIF